MQTKQKAVYTIDKNVLKEFKEHAKNNQINMSAKVEALIKKELKDNKGK